MFFGIGTPLTVVSVTDVFLPMVGIHVPRLGSSSVVAIGAVAAWSIRRYGYFLLAPGAFTHEILETLRDGVALVNPDGGILTSNGALALLAGSSRKALIGTSIRDWMPELGDVLDGNAGEIEVELQREPDPPMLVSVSSSPIQDDRGQFVGCVLVVRDLQEVEVLRNRLVRSDRLAAVGELAAGIAHEINNPITFVRSNLLELRRLWSTLEQEAEKTDRAELLSPLFGEATELLEESVEGVDRITAITRGVGEISHAGLDDSEWADIHELLDNAISVAALSYSVVVERRYADLPRVRCNPQQLKQVFLNLLLNAFEAIGDFGQILLVTRAAQTGVTIEVQDDGCGIQPDAIDRSSRPAPPEKAPVSASLSPTRSSATTAARSWSNPHRVGVPSLPSSFRSRRRSSKAPPTPRAISQPEPRHGVIATNGSCPHPPIPCDPCSRSRACTSCRAASTRCRHA
jgi:signal transduction histidine kinase